MGEADQLVYPIAIYRHRKGRIRPHRQLLQRLVTPLPIQIHRQGPGYVPRGLLRNSGHRRCQRNVDVARSTLGAHPHQVGCPVAVEIKARTGVAGPLVSIDPIAARRDILEAVVPW